MNSLSIVILIATFINGSYGFWTNCNESVSLPCNLFMTPYENAYQNVFLGILDPILRFVYHLGLKPNETTPEEIAAENVRIQTLVGSGTIEEFFKQLLGLNRGYERRVYIVPEINNKTDFSNFTRNENNSNSMTWEDFSNIPRNNFFKKFIGIFKHKKN
uniref:Uncharacterized protein n=1 Tax=Strongyloides venezuelensis TaxID=75913 RepID=A0A0K0FIT8_STRVS